MLTLSIGRHIGIIKRARQSWSSAELFRNLLRPGPSMSNPSLKTVEFKIYPNVLQQQELDRYLRICCRTCNQALECRKKTYKETGKGLSYYDQCRSLTDQRRQDPELEAVPVEFLRDALRRIDRGMKDFFRRCKAGEKPGFPRFKPEQRYNSLESLIVRSYIAGNRISIPKLGTVRANGPFHLISETQNLLCVIRRASGWYAQVVVEATSKPLPKTGQECGLDLGLTHFLTLDSGETVANPRTLKKASEKLRSAHKKLSRRQKGSRRRTKAKRELSRSYERVARQREGFCHKVSRDLVSRFDRIAYEDLNIKSMVRGRLAKSILDASWGFFIFCLVYKAECAGKTTAKVDPRGTSQECPGCGAVKKKQLSKRTHACPCGLVIPRDQASGIIIRNRAFRPGRGDPLRPLEIEAGSGKRVGST